MHGNDTGRNPLGRDRLAFALEMLGETLHNVITEKGIRMKAANARKETHSLCDSLICSLMYFLWLCDIQGMSNCMMASLDT